MTLRMNTNHKKTSRVKYLRLQEKLLQSSLTILKLENFNYELFCKKALKIVTKIENIPEIRADSSYINSLKKFSDLVKRTIENDRLKIEEKKEVLLKEANLIDKQKNKKLYKRKKNITEDD